jgi:putative transposase
MIGHGVTSEPSGRIRDSLIREPVVPGVAGRWRDLPETGTWHRTARHSLEHATDDEKSIHLLCRTGPPAGGLPPDDWSAWTRVKRTGYSRADEMPAEAGGGSKMRKSKFTDEQIAMALRQAEGGTPVAEICRKLQVTEATFYRWRKKFGGLGVPELRELRQLREENRRLKGLVADLSVDKEILREAVRKKW